LSSFNVHFVFFEREGRYEHAEPTQSTMVKSFHRVPGAIRRKSDGLSKICIGTVELWSCEHGYLVQRCDVRMIIHELTSNSELQTLRYWAKLGKSRPFTESPWAPMAGS
jgi:hypothetical protein